MTAARSYKQPMSTRAARAELARCAGAHFDPQAVRAFLNISLPRLLWAMGPLALLVHLPFLRSLETAGAQLGATVATGAGATVLAVGVSVVPAPHPAPQPRVVAQQEAGTGRVETARITVPRTARPVQRAAPPAHASPRPSASAGGEPVRARQAAGTAPERQVVRPAPRSAAAPPPGADGRGDAEKRKKKEKEKRDKQRKQKENPKENPKKRAGG
jgi:hypothetical protein